MASKRLRQLPQHESMIVQHRRVSPNMRSLMWELLRMGMLGAVCFGAAQTVLFWARMMSFLLCPVTVYCDIQLSVVGLHSTSMSSGYDSFTAKAVSFSFQPARIGFTASTQLVW